MTPASENAQRTWTPAMELDDLWENDMAGVEVGDAKVLLVNVDGEVQAYQNSCPHQATVLDEGEFEDGTITCWRHLWQFDARTGAGVNPADSALTRYPCQIDDAGMICVDVTAEQPKTP
jgi:toluene monooxygenase system ferredoxin subunit